MFGTHFLLHGKTGRNMTKQVFMISHHYLYNHKIRTLRSCYSINLFNYFSEVAKPEIIEKRDQISIAICSVLYCFHLLAIETVITSLGIVNASFVNKQVRIR